MAMKNPNYVPLDNIYSKSDGFVARQVGTNNPGLRTLTWEFNFRCTSFVTIPINHTTSEFEIHFRDYSNYSHFGDILRKANISHLRIIDLNILLDAVAAIIAKHRILVASSRIVGPFYCKAHILNAWRTVPFIDTEEYVNHVEEMGLPIVQDENIIVPPGTRLESFINLPERDASQLTDTEIYGDAGQVAIFVLAALGIPPDLFISDMADILRAGIRAKLISRRRSEPT